MAELLLNEHFPESIHQDILNNLVAIDAAHIQWHQAGGPDTEENGIALCTLHHKLFDRGVFTITDDLELLVAEQAHCTHGFEEWLMRFHGKKVLRQYILFITPYGLTVKHDRRRSA